MALAKERRRGKGVCARLNKMMGGHTRWWYILRAYLSVHLFGLGAVVGPRLVLVVVVLRAHLHVLLAVVIIVVVVVTLGGGGVVAAAVAVAVAARGGGGMLLGDVDGGGGGLLVLHHAAAAARLGLADLRGGGGGKVGGDVELDEIRSRCWATFYHFTFKNVSFLLALSRSTRKNTSSPRG